MFIHWCNCYSIKANALAMVVNIVGPDDGSELIIHGMSYLLAHRTLGYIVSVKSLRNLVTWELFAESKISSAISEVSIAAAMDRVKGRGDVITSNDCDG